MEGKESSRFELIGRGIARIFGDNLVNAYDEFHAAAQPRFPGLAKAAANELAARTVGSHLDEEDRSAAIALVARTLDDIDPHSVWGAATGGVASIESAMRTRSYVAEIRDFGESGAREYAEVLLKTTAARILQVVRGTGAHNVALFEGVSALRQHNGLETLARHVDDLAAELRRETPRVDLEQFQHTSVTARADLDPDVLPSVDRLGALENFMTTSGALVYPLAVLGDGGIGKSVLAGQIYDLLVRAGRRAFLVPCADISRGTALTTVATVERAFATAATGAEDPPVLSAALRALAVEEPPVLIFDTLDLLLRDETAIAVRDALHGLMESYSVVVTCREREWVDFSLGRGLIQLSTVRLPRLAPAEVMSWVEKYQLSNPERAGALFVEDVRRVSAHGGFSEILGVPLRLAMACELYGTHEQLPDDLTVGALYRAYWDQRVARDRQQLRGPSAAQQEQAALDVAASIWSGSTAGFVEAVGVPRGQEAAIGRLLGEGVIRWAGPQVKFFHQTFAEFAVAQHLQRYGTDDDLERLMAQLSRHDSGSWGVAGYLLDERLDDDQYHRLRRCIPLDAEGVRVLTRAALERPSAPTTHRLLRALASKSPENLRHNVTLLAGVSDDLIRGALETAISLLDTPRQGDNRIAEVIAALGQRLSAVERAEVVSPAIASLAERWAPLAAPSTADVIVRLLRAYPSPLMPTDAASLTRIYPRLPEPARLAILSLITSADASHETDVLEVALRAPVPPGGVDHCVRLLLAAWQQDQLGQANRWRSWRDLLFSAYPQRWDAAQLRTIAKLAEADETIRTEVLQEALHPTGPVDRARLNNCAEFIASHDPAAAAMDMVRIGVGANPMAVATGAALCNWLGHRPLLEMRVALTETLVTQAHLDPRKAWPAIIRLTMDDVVERDQAIARLMAFVNDPESSPEVVARTRRNVVEALTMAGDPKQLLEMTAFVDGLLRKDSPKDRAVRARFIGVLASVSPQARAEVHELVLNDPSNDAAAGAARSIVDGLDKWNRRELSTAGAIWLVGLLDSHHPMVVALLANALHDRLNELTWTKELTEKVVRRLLRALAGNEAAQVSDGLLQLLAGLLRRDDADEGYGPTALQVRELVQSYQRAVAAHLSAPDKRTPGQLPLLWSGLQSVLSALALPLLDQGEIEQIVLGVLRMDPSLVSNRATRSTASTLVSFVRRYPHRWQALESVWDSYPASSQAALVECLERGRVAGSHEIAQRLAREPSTGEHLRARLLAIAER